MMWTPTRVTGGWSSLQFAKLDLSRSPRTRDCPPPFNVIDPGQLIGALRPMHDSRRAKRYGREKAWWDDKEIEPIALAHSLWTTSRNGSVMAQRS